MELDTLILNGKIIDGTGNPWYKADIGIKDGKIIAIGRLRNNDAEKIISADGLIVSPGFIDMHSHSDFPLIVDGDAQSKIRQGITLEVVGNCGSSAAPLLGELRERIKENEKRYQIKIDWRYMGEYIERLKRQGTSVNVAPLVGFSNVRIAVLGYEKRDPTKEELEEMKNILKRALDEGAVGLSTGLRYDPQSFAKTEEVIELAKIVSKHGGIYSTHIRDEGDRGRLLEAIQEAIKIGREANVPVEISHLKILAKPLWDKCDEMLELIENARKEMIEVTADQYPYEASGTGLLAWIPKWANAGGRENLIERPNTPEIREEIKEFRKDYRKVHYCFHEGLNGYEYHRLV